MKIQKRDGMEERQILIGMITNQLIISKISTLWNRQLFQSKWSNLIGDWCVSYFVKYGKPPSRSIEQIFQSWSTSKTRDKNTVELIEKFLGGLSAEYEAVEEVNPEYIIDLAGRYFNRVKLSKLSEEIQGDLDIGDLDKASGRVNTYTKLEIGAGAAVDLLTDQLAIKTAFETKGDPLVTYPGALGQFFGDAFERDAFIAFMGPEKRGKSFWLLDVAWRAMLQRRKVVFFEAGDLSQNQVIRRFMVRAARKPIKPKRFLYPTGIEKDPKTGIVEVSTDKKNFDTGLSWGEAMKACEKVMRLKTKTKEPLLRLSVHANSTLSVGGMQTILQGWEREGWVPDVIVIDYADILAPPPGVQETRDQINATWKLLRSMSQTFHCLVVTATQADAGSYGVKTIGRKNFSEDKRKMAHVTGMIGINATDEEKEDGIMRLNWVVLREGEFIERRCVNVASCLDLANPAVHSIL